MGEKVYKVMKGAGAWNIVLGIMMIVLGIAAGVLNIIIGGKLLKNKRNLMF